jgi:hypothetical protein
MGWDIESHAEKRAYNGWIRIHGIMPFTQRNYGVFGFLADVMNLSAVTPISRPRGVPPDASDEVNAAYKACAGDVSAASWLSLAELTNFNYDAEIEDRRVRIGGSAGTCPPGQGRRMSFRELLEPAFFKDLEALKKADAERVVFWFDH